MEFKMSGRICTVFLGVVCCGQIGQVLAQTSDTRPSNLFESSLEELKQTKIIVSSVSKRDQDLFGAAAAIYVITAEDIRRSGLTSLPELLRLAPGMDVAQITSQKWMVSARGFNNLYADKLLVLVDGRTVYTPLFGGVYWEVQDYPLEDIDRIEVIRGPGATLWGANAVNGVVNIISKKAKETQGTLLAGLGGSYDRAMGLARHGGKLGDSAYYRVYGKYFKRDALVDSTGSSMRDDWNIKSGGFLAEGKLQNDHWMLQGRKYRGGGLLTNTIASLPRQTTVSENNTFLGQHILGTWAHPFASGSDLDAKVYYDQTWRNERPLYQENRYIFDVEVQHHYTRFSRQDIVWGGGYRASSGKITVGDYVIAVDPEKRVERTYNFFVQDDIALKPNFHLTLGSKVEKNVFTGVELEPSARFNWLPSLKHSLWGAISRAVRVPTRVFRDITTDDSTTAGVPFPIRLRILPNKEIDSERLNAFELGYRVRPTQTVFSDFTVFYNEYCGERGSRSQGVRFRAVPVPHLLLSVLPINAIDARTFGFEWFADWQVFPRWKLKAGYSYLDIQAKSTDPADTTGAPYWEATGPKNQFQLHSDWDLPSQVTVGIGVYYVDGLDQAPPLLLQKTPSYVRTDLRLAWKPFNQFLLALVGQNLLDRRHQEGHSGLGNYQEGEVERSVYLKLQWEALK